MQNWYFTFGYAHHTKHGVPLRNNYVKISGEFMEARKTLMKIRGRVWSMQYTEEQFLPQIEKYGLHEISLQDCE